MKTGRQALLIVLVLSVFLNIRAQGATLVITNVALSKGTVGIAYKAQLGATNGQTPYSWSLATNSASLPFGLTLKTNGLISGTPTTVQTNNFIVQVVDANSSQTNKNLSIRILPRPVIFPPTPVTNCQFQITLDDVCGVPITIQFSTNLVNWVNLLTTNLPCGIVTLTLTPPTCGIGFWRAVEFCPAFTVNPSALTFTDPSGGPVVLSQSITISNASPDCALNYDIATNATWLSTSSTQGSLAPGTSATVSVSVSDYFLNYWTTNQGAIVISDHDYPTNSVSLPVTFIVQGPQPFPVVYPSSATVSASGDCPQSITISNAGAPNSMLNFQVYVIDPNEAAFITIGVQSGSLVVTGSLRSTESIAVPFNVAPQYAYNINDMTVGANVYAPNTSLLSQ